MKFYCHKCGEEMQEGMVKDWVQCCNIDCPESPINEEA